MGKIIRSLLTIAFVSAIAVGATGAYFNDSAVSENNVIAAGTLDLKVNGEDDSITEKFTAADIAPGYDSGYKIFCLTNTGSITGQPSVSFSAISNNENGITGPEAGAESLTYASATEGELGQYLKYTIGWGPCGWTVPSRLVSGSQTGPVHPWGTPGLNDLSGNTYFGSGGTKFPTLNQGDTIGFFIKVSLDNDLRRWDGTKWLEADDNIIQSDGIDFDLTFTLDQAV